MRIGVFTLESVVALYIRLTAALKLRLCIFPRNVFVCFIWFTEWTAIVLLYNINKFLVMGMLSVFCEVESSF
jgi:hypothetical protein